MKTNKQIKEALKTMNKLVNKSLNANTQLELDLLSVKLDIIRQYIYLLEDLA